MLYSYYPLQTRYPMNRHTFPRNGTPQCWQAPFYNSSHQPYPYGECYQSQQLTHYQSQDFTSCSYPQYGQTYQESPLEISTKQNGRGTTKNNRVKMQTIFTRRIIKLRKLIGNNSCPK